jgi:nucleotide-binding universal stress UspA family protein
MSPVNLTTEVKSLLVAYDFSEASRKALHHALQIARHYRAKLYLAYVVSSVGYEIAGPGSSQLASEASWREARQLETELLKTGALAGLSYEFIIREGNIWEQLNFIIREKDVDAVVVGTHGRSGLGKLVLGSVAELIFRQADCLVLTVGLRSPEDSLVGKEDTVRPFLLATDFGAASLRALPHAASFANHFCAKLVILHVFQPCPIPEGFHWSTCGDLVQMQRQAELAGRKQFEELILPRVPADTKIEFIAKFGTVSDQVLQTCRALNAELLVLGLNHSEHIETASHLPWAVAHNVVCRATCPVLTVKADFPPSDSHFN